MKTTAAKCRLRSNERELVGALRRFAIEPFTGRDGATTWFVADAEIRDDATGQPKVVGQADSRDAALAVVARLDRPGDLGA